jgi:hypothetical protein
MLALVCGRGIFWSSGKAQTAFLQSIMCGPISAVRYMARWTGTLLGRWTICLGVRWWLRLTLAAFTIKPSEAEFPLGLAKCFTGAASTSRLHLQAKHYRECSSEADAGESLYVYLRRTSPLYFFIAPNPSKYREPVPIVAQIGLFNKAERCLLGTLE